MRVEKKGYKERTQIRKNYCMCGWWDRNFFGLHFPHVTYATVSHSSLSTGKESKRPRVDLFFKWRICWRSHANGTLFMPRFTQHHDTCLPPNISVNHVWVLWEREKNKQSIDRSQNPNRSLRCLMCVSKPSVCIFLPSTKDFFLPKINLGSHLRSLSGRALGWAPFVSLAPEKLKRNPIPFLSHNPEQRDRTASLTGHLPRHLWTKYEKICLSWQ